MCVFACLGLASFAQAQSAITGTVRDPSGAVLPGVTVEAASPVLIEKVKSAVTDAAGQYRIVDLRPGTYSVTFTLSGFTTLRRDEIELPANFTASLNADLRIGGIEESVTVSGASPVVDVQSTERRSNLSREVLDALPTARSYQTIGQTLPALTSGAGRFDVGGSTSMWQSQLAAFGGRAQDMAINIDGLSMNTPFASGQTVSFYHNDGAYQEMVYQISSGSAETQTPGVSINMIPREGGNRYSSSFIGIYSNDGLQSTNFSEELRARGLTAPARLDRYVGRERRRGRAHRARPAVVLRLASQLGVQQPRGGRLPAEWRAGGGRQPRRGLYGSTHAAGSRPRNKLTAAYENNPRWRGHRDIETGLVSPEATGLNENDNAFFTQAKWTSTVTNKLLFELGMSLPPLQLLDQLSPGGAPRDVYGGVHELSGRHGLRRHLARRDHEQLPDGGRAARLQRLLPEDEHHLVALARHRLPRVQGGAPVGLGQARELARDERRHHPALPQRCGEPGPDQEHADLRRHESRCRRGRLRPGHLDDPTADAEPRRALRMVQQLDPGAVGARRPLRPRPAVRRDPRRPQLEDLGAAARGGLRRIRRREDGDQGKRRQVPAAGGNRIRHHLQSRGGVDGHAQLDRLERATTSRRRTRSGRGNANFGTRRNRNADPDIDRPYQLVYNLTVQRELASGISATFSYNRRTFHNQIYTINLAAPLTEYTLASVPDPRGNGELLPVFNINRPVFGLVDELDTNSGNETTFNGFDVSVTGRFAGGQITAGTSTGRSRSVACDVGDPNSLRFCDDMVFDIPWRTTFKTSASYPLPAGFRVGAVFQSIAGAERAILYPVDRTILPTLVQPSVNVRLNEPGTEYEDRVYQLDVNLGKTFQLANLRIAPQVELFNIFNANPVTTQVNTYGSSLGRPLTVLAPRLVRLGVQVNF